MPFSPKMLPEQCRNCCMKLSFGLRSLRHLLHRKVFIFTSDLCSWPHLLSQSCTFGLQTLCQDKHTVMLLTELDQTAGLAGNKYPNNTQLKLCFVIRTTLGLLQCCTTQDNGERAGLWLEQGLEADNVSLSQFPICLM